MIIDRLNPSTVIKFRVPSPGLVSLRVYDAFGRFVRTLIDKTERSGNYEVEFDAKGMSSGVYFCTMKTGGQSRTVKMVFLK